MPENPETITVNYLYKQQKDGTVIIKYKGTQLNLSNEEHRHKLEVYLKVMGAHLLALANGVDIDNVII